MPIMHPVIRTVLLCSVFMLLLSACGQKGPLFLPPGEPAAEPLTERDNGTVRTTETTTLSESITPSETPAN